MARACAEWNALSARTALPLDSKPFGSESRWQSYAASIHQVAAAQRQLRALHEADDIPDPIASAFVDWGSDPFGGAWHVWNVRSRSWEVIPRIIQPLRGSDFYICGEAYTWSQGWVEGALESAGHVVARLI